MKWDFKEAAKKPKLNNPVLIEGLPGIGNVGKLIVDFIIENLKAKKLCDIFSYTFPHSVFVNDKNLVELPSIELYYVKFNDKRRDLLILTGDIQPIEEVSSYEFTEALLDYSEKFGCKEIITLGGIGLNEVPKSPKIYCTGTSAEIVKKYVKDTKVIDKLYGVVGPIIGVAGILLGMGAKRGMQGVAFLAETLSHPMYIGAKGSREILKIMDKKLSLSLDFKKLDKEINNLDTEMLKTSQELTEVSKSARKKAETETSYIG